VLHFPLVGDLFSSVLTSECLLMSMNVLCSVCGRKTEFTLYILFTELYTARVWRYRVTYDQHPRTNYSTEFPLYLSPHPITISPGVAVAVAFRLLTIIAWSLLSPNSSPAEAIHQQGAHLRSRPWSIQQRNFF